MKTIINILHKESAALDASAQAFERGCATFSEGTFRAWLRECEQVVFIGVGKSGHVARKAAASFASLGFRAYFCHAAELMHGDLGAIDARTLAVFASFSGRGAEILAAAAQVCARTRMTAALSAPGSALAGLCAMNLPLLCAEAIDGMPAPTSSTTLTLALCDGLLALAAEEFALGAEDFGRHHPGGALGKRYYERVRDCLQPARTLRAGASLREAIAAMSGAGYAVLVEGEGDGGGERSIAPLSRGDFAGCECSSGVDRTCSSSSRESAKLPQKRPREQARVVAFLSDGDLRRALEAPDFSLDNLAIAYASKSPVAVAPDMLAHDARELAKSRQISTLLVLEGATLLGVMRLI